MNWLQEIKRIDTIAKDCFAKFGLNYDYYNVEVSFSKRMTRCAGKAGCKFSDLVDPEDMPYLTPVDEVDFDRLYMKFSCPLWLRATPEQRDETIVHEICHVLDYILNGKSNGHNRVWKQLMIKCGYPPKRCHNIDRTGIARRNKRVAASCPCGNMTSLGSTQAGRLRRGTFAYRCRKCKGDIVLT